MSSGHGRLLRLISKEKSDVQSIILLFLSLFSAVAFSILFASLELFLTQKYLVSETFAATVMGVFLGFNYSINLFGSYIGGRLISYRFLFVIGSLIQLVACYFLLTALTKGVVLIALGLFIVSTGVMTPCIRMMVLQQYEHNDIAREKAFLWNYAGMNIGFTLGFVISGLLQAHQDFLSMFLYCLFANLITLLIILTGWKYLKDHSTPLAKWYKHNKNFKRYLFKLLFALVLIAMLITFTDYLMTRAQDTQVLLIGIAILLIGFFIYKVFKAESKNESQRTLAFLLLSSSKVIFWSIYQLIPTGLVFFIMHDIDRSVMNYQVTPQFFNLINTILIIMGGFVFPLVFRKVREKNKFDIPIQFSFSLFGIALSLLILLLGIYSTDFQGHMNMLWLVASYCVIAIAELLIAPIGSSMIAILATENMQGLMMGTWMFLSGTAAVIAGKVSSLVAEGSKHQSIVELNHHYASLFVSLFLIAILASALLFFFRNFLRGLIHQES